MRLRLSLVFSQKHMRIPATRFSIMFETMRISFCGSQ